jgi:hypothetical protein
VQFSQSPLTVYDVDEWDPLSFLSDGEEDQHTLCPQYLEDIGEKTAVILTDHGLSTYPHNDSRCEGEEVGDDRIDLSLNQKRLSCALVCQESICGMVTSWSDTFLSTELWNFCETTSTVPLHEGQSFDKCRKVGEFDDLGFIDVPPLRILLDVSKGDMSHSSTAVGKATMLASRMRTPRSEFLKDWHLSSYLQDGYLRTSRSSDPKYLPQVMGGSGARALFSNPSNLYLYTHAYRGGICQRIYGSATRELRQSLDSLVRGEVLMPILCQRLRDRQEYLHGTYGEKIFIPTKEYSDSFGERLPAPLVRQSGGANLFASFEQRLVRTRHVLTRSSAEREWENTLRIRGRLLLRYRGVKESEEREAFDRKRARSEYGDAVFANTAFSNLLSRRGTIEDVIQLTNDNHHVVRCGATSFTKWDAEWLFFGGKAEGFSIDDLTFSEDLYLRKEVSEDETMRVGSILLRPVTKHGKRVLTTTTVGLYQIGSGMFEWAADLADRLKNHRDELGRPLTAEDALKDYEKDPEWVNDDTLIIAKCLRDTSKRTQSTSEVILVSADRRLGNQLANSCNCAVYRVDPRDYIPWSRESGLSQQSLVDPVIIASYFNTRGRRVNPVATYVDTGSMGSYLSRIETREGNLFVKRITSTGRLPDGRRTVSYHLTQLNVPADLRYAYHAPVAKHRKFTSGDPLYGETIHRRSVLSSLGLSQQSWRKGL